MDPDRRRSGPQSNQSFLFDFRELLQSSEESRLGADPQPMDRVPGAHENRAGTGAVHRRSGTNRSAGHAASSRAQPEHTPLTEPGPLTGRGSA